MSATDARPDLLTPAEVCDTLRVSYPTFRRMIARGDLQVVRLGTRNGSSIRVSSAELDRLLNHHHEGDQAA